jgi:hypothetical protein
MKTLTIFLAVLLTGCATIESKYGCAPETKQALYKEGIALNKKKQALIRQIEKREKLPTEEFSKLGRKDLESALIDDLNNQIREYHRAVQTYERACVAYLIDYIILPSEMVASANP